MTVNPCQGDAQTLKFDGDAIINMHLAVIGNIIMDETREKNNFTNIKNKQITSEFGKCSPLLIVDLKAAVRFS